MKQTITALVLIGQVLFMAGYVCSEEPQPGPVTNAVIRKEPEVTAAAHFNVSSASVGSALAYTVSFRWLDDGTTYRLTPPHLDPLGLEVVNVATETESVEDDGVRYKVRNYVYELKAVTPGDAMVEALTISYYADGSTDPFFVTLPAMSLTVSDVKRPLMGDSRSMAVFALAASVLVAIAIVVLIRRARRRKPAEISPAEKIAADITALQELFEKGEYNKVIEALASVARSYLLDVVKIPSNERVSAEALRDQAVFRTLSEKQRSAIIKVLKRAEEARYSGMQYERHEVRTLMDDLAQAINVSKR